MLLSPAALPPGSSRISVSLILLLYILHHPTLHPQQPCPVLSSASASSELAANTEAVVAIPTLTHYNSNSVAALHAPFRILAGAGLVAVGDGRAGAVHGPGTALRQGGRRRPAVDGRDGAGAEDGRRPTP